MTDLIGQTIGQYRIVDRIGKGGMADVYKAYQPGLDRYVAIKILPEYFVRDETFLARFQREARAIAKLSHSHILPVYDFGQQGDLTYIVMQYVEAGTLKAILDELLDLQWVAEIIDQIASALDYAHRQGIIHRDVKPSNVLMEHGERALLTDFGLAKMTEASVQLTGSGVGVGTPAYMSPEQGQGAGVDARSDVYSLGVVLYEMVTGRVPYTAETPMAVVIKHITEPLPLPRSVNPALPEVVERVVLKALAKDPADRFASAGEMAQALRSAVAGLSVEAEPVPPPAKVAVESAAPQPAHQPVRRVGFPWAWAAGGVIVVGLLAVAAILVTSKEESPMPTVPAVARATATPMPTAAPTSTPPPSDAPVPPMLTDTPVPPTPTYTPISPTPTHTLVPPTSTDTPTTMPTNTFTPIPTHTPTQTPVPTPTFTSIPVGGLLLVEDFQDPSASKFSAREDERKKFYFEGGEYHILAKEAHSGAAFGILTDFSDFALEVDARFVDGPEKWVYGFMFRYQDGDNTYRYLTSYNGEYALLKAVSGKWDTLVDWTWSPHIITGTGTNHLRVVCRGSEITMYVNGHYLDTITDHSLSAGKPGVHVGTFEEPNVHVAFDNLMVWSVPQ